MSHFTSINPLKNSFAEIQTLCKWKLGILFLIVSLTWGCNKPPIALFTYTPSSGEAPLKVTFDASASHDPDGQVVSYDWNFGDGQTGKDAVMEHLYSTPDTFTVKLTVSDNDGKRNSISKTLVVNRSAIPSDPSEVATPVDRSIAANLTDATEFLYTGHNPIQTGVEHGTMNRARITVLRGKVLTQDGKPLSGVTITVSDCPEFGQTLSRADGMFDLAVNGGGVINLNYEKQGFLSIQRRRHLPWQRYIWLPDVVLIPTSQKATTISLGGAVSPQAMSGSRVIDHDGSRQTTLVFPQGTQAELVMQNGRSRSVDSLSIRVIEYTAGTNGPNAMPAELPPTSGFTYAVEFSADEAEGFGAKEVRFDKPLIHYVENFLNFPVGMPVPTGYYDRDKGVWIPSQNGLVVRLLDTDSDGLVDALDDDPPNSDGYGLPDDLNGDGSFNDEVTGLDEPTRYLADSTYWRVPITHFSPWDCNWPYGPGQDAKPPDEKGPQDNIGSEGACQVPGSIIECQNQVLGESIPIVGTGFTLNYRSNRTPAYKALYTIDIPLIGDNVPESLIGIELEIQVAGQQFTAHFNPEPNQRFPWTWDGKDAYGRVLQGRHSATIRLGYTYPAVYQEPANFEQSFGQLSGIPISGNRARQDVTLWREWNMDVGTWDARGAGLGGWTFDIHHAYDPGGKVLYLGNGHQRSALSVSKIIHTFAGNGKGYADGDGGLATDAGIGFIDGVAVGSNGSVFFHGDKVIRRVDSENIITTVAGSGRTSFNGDSFFDENGVERPNPISATEVNLTYVRGVDVGPDGSLYIGNSTVVMQLKDGFLRIIAGSPKYERGFAGDGGPAKEALLSGAIDLEVAPNGNLYIADFGNKRIRLVDTGGIITTFAGGGTGPDKYDPVVRATSKYLDYVTGVAIGPNGIVYVISQEGLFAVGTDGWLRTLAGDGTVRYEGNNFHGIPATDTKWNTFQHDVEVNHNGIVFFSIQQKVYRIRNDGILERVAGNSEDRPSSGYGGDGGPPMRAYLQGPDFFAFGPNGDLYISDAGNRRIRRVGSPLPGYDFSPVGELSIPSEDGTELYFFDGSGRHLRTEETLRGTVVYQFAYDASGRLEGITDAFNNVTRVQREPDGKTLAILSPYNQRTTLTLDNDGYLKDITNPANEVTQFTYKEHGSGLLSTFTDPRGNISSFTYDAFGRLIREDDPAGGFQELVRDNLPAFDGYQVARTTAMGRTTTYQVKHGQSGYQTLYENIFPCGCPSTKALGKDGDKSFVLLPDSTRTDWQEGPDPRFGMQAPIQKNMIITTPHGLKSTMESSRSVSLTNPSDPLSLETSTDTFTINGRTYTSAFDGAQNRITTTTPEGRKITSNLDEYGRIISMQIPGLAPTRLSYDEFGRLDTLTQGAGNSARMTTIAYRPDGFVDYVTDPLRQVVRFEYDPAGRVITQTQPDGQMIGFGYDSNGNLKSITPPGRPKHNFTHSPINLLDTYTPPDVGIGNTMTDYDYDLDRKLQAMVRPDGQIVMFGYNQTTGQLETITQPGGVNSYTYYLPSGNLHTITAPDGGSVEHIWDGYLLTDVKWSGTVSGTVSFGYNNDFRLSAQSINNENTVTFGYDADELLTTAGALTITRNPQNGLISQTILSDVTTSRTYSEFGELDSMRALYNDTPLFRVRYMRDALGRITQKIETIGGVTSTYEYRYNATGQLEDVYRNSEPISHYQYDANGNRLAHTMPQGTVAGTYDDQDRMVSCGAASYTYTANGELLTKVVGVDTTRYKYDVFGNLIAVDLLGGNPFEIEYLVDGQNRRIGKKVDGALVQGFLYQDQLNPVAELDGNGNVVSRFVYATRNNVPDYIIMGGSTYSIVSDYLGTVRLVVNVANGSIAQRMDYDEFGNVLLDTNQGFQPFGFAGGIYDADTRLVRFGVRDYDPSTGRWTSKDPFLFMSREANLYVYAQNDPITRRDPTGAQACCPVGYGECYSKCMEHYLIDLPRLLAAQLVTAATGSAIGQAVLGSAGFDIGFGFGGMQGAAVGTGVGVTIGEAAYIAGGALAVGTVGVMSGCLATCSFDRCAF